MQPTHQDHSKLYIPAAIIIAGIIIGVFAMIGLQSLGSASLQGAQPTVAVNIDDVSTEGEPYIGDADAPVTLAFWADYQCPFCKAVEVGGVDGIAIDPALPELVKQYVDTGKLRIVFKDYPFLGEDSTTAAEYGRAVWDLYPDQYFAWRTAMYEAQDAEGDQGFGDAASIDDLIASKFPQMDLDALHQALTDKKDQYDAAIEADRTEGTGFGINGTPGFITGETLIPGAVELPTFSSAIDAQL